MFRNALRSSWVWIWIATAGLVSVCIGIANYRGHQGYRNALAIFGVQSSTYSAEMAAVVDSVLSRAPIGSPHSRVIAVLDSLGFTPSPDPFDRKPAFHIDSTHGHRAIYAHWPFPDPPLSLDRFVCDRPALRLSFQFDDAWKLAAADANTLRACI